jgi:hypothetical protein
MHASNFPAIFASLFAVLNIPSMSKELEAACVIIRPLITPKAIPPDPPERRLRAP